jgi:hypothetical protein
MVSWTTALITRQTILRLVACERKHGQSAIA